MTLSALPPPPLERRLREDRLRPSCSTPAQPRAPGRSWEGRSTGHITCLALQRGGCLYGLARACSGCFVSDHLSLLLKKKKKRRTREKERKEKNLMWTNKACWKVARQNFFLWKRVPQVIAAAQPYLSSTVATHSPLPTPNPTLASAGAADGAIPNLT